MLLSAVFLLVMSHAGFTPAACESDHPSGLKNVLTIYRASDRFQAVGQISVREDEGKLKFSAAADSSEGLSVSSADLEEGCVLKKKILLFNKCVFKVESVKKESGKYFISTGDGIFEYIPGDCAFYKEGKRFNGFQVTKSLKRKISILPNLFPSSVAGEFPDSLP